MPLRKPAPQRKPELLSQLEKSRIFFQPIPGSSEVLLDCPTCGKDKHLYVNVIKRCGFCQKCKKAFNHRLLVKALKLPGTDGAYNLQQAATPSELAQLHESIFGQGRKATQAAQESLPQCDLPLGAQLAVRHPKALKYLLQRGLPLRDIQLNEIRYCPYGPYYNRILFPVFWDDKLVGFNTRTLQKNFSPKYLTNKNFPSSKVLYPQANLRMGRLVITEGVVPAILYQGVATFGKKLSEEQLKILMRSWYTRQLVLAWDRDAWTSTPGTTQDPPALKAWETLKEYYPCAGLILPEEKPQPDDFTRSVFQSVIEQVWKKSPSKSMIWKIDSSGRAERYL